MNPIIKNIFYNRSLVIATMHKKEKVIQPLLENALGVKVIVPENFDTDIFGTFSGEVERTVDPLEAARLKCKMASEKHSCTLALASEGSFGPHPSIPFVAGNDEIIVLIDYENGLEFKVRKITSQTNFRAELFHHWNDAENFAKSVLFPSHSLIIRNKKDGNERLVKGINAWDKLKSNAEAFLNAYGQFYLETDMRAMHNPTRMGIIEETTKKLIEIINSICPNCNTPGFNITHAKSGLTCSQCGMPTQSTLAYIYECQKCHFNKEELYPNGKQHEDPMYCNWCNP